VKPRAKRCRKKIQPHENRQLGLKSRHKIHLAWRMASSVSVNSPFLPKPNITNREKLRSEINRVDEALENSPHHDAREADSRALDLPVPPSSPYFSVCFPPDLHIPSKPIPSHYGSPAGPALSMSCRMLDSILCPSVLYKGIARVPRGQALPVEPNVAVNSGV
jgi:hypothetical protein